MVEGIKENSGKLSNLWTLLNLSSEGFVLCNKKGEIQIETKLEYKNRSNIEHESKRELDVEIKVKV